jgi:hypothetical protein
MARIGFEDSSARPPRAAPPKDQIYAPLNVIPIIPIQWMAAPRSPQ